MSGIIGKKIGMTSVYDDSGKNIPCTVIEAGPCVITQIKTSVTDGYNALQLAFDDQKDRQDVFISHTPPPRIYEPVRSAESLKHF